MKVASKVGREAAGGFVIGVASNVRVMRVSSGHRPKVFLSLPTASSSVFRGSAGWTVIVIFVVAMAGCSGTNSSDDGSEFAPSVTRRDALPDAQALYLPA